MLSTTLEAAQQGNLEELKRLIDSGCPINWYAKPTALSKNDLEMGKYLHSISPVWPPFSTSWAARDGAYEALVWAHENGCPWRSVSSELAAANGNTKCLKYMFENGCPVESAATAVASKGGHLDTLKYLIEEAKITLHPYAKVWATNTEVLAYINSLNI